MKILNNLNDIPKAIDTVVTIGSFDGVHLGHQAILQMLKQTAKAMNCESVVITFNPHPQKILHPESNFKEIYSLEQNVQLIGKEGIDNILILPFTKDFSQLSFQTFIEEVIINKLHAKALVMGPHHSIGRGKEGNHQKIVEYGKSKDLSIIEIPEFMIRDNCVRSQQIREYIQQGKIEKVTLLLGHPYQLQTKS